MRGKFILGQFGRSNTIRQHVRFFKTSSVDQKNKHTTTPQLFDKQQKPIPIDGPVKTDPYYSGPDDVVDTPVRHSDDGPDHITGAGPHFLG